MDKNKKEKWLSSKYLEACISSEDLLSKTCFVGHRKGALQAPTYMLRIRTGGLEELQDKQLDMEFKREGRIGNRQSLTTPNF